MSGSPSGEQRTAGQYVCTRLNEDHYLQNFDCGRDSNLTDWLQTKAHAYVEEGLCSVWVLSPAHDPEDVAGFFTLAAHEVRRDMAARRDRTNERRNGNIVGSLAAHPAHLLGKFAVDEQHQGSGLANLLMLRVYEKFLEASHYSAAKYLVLDAQEEGLVDYYQQRHGFSRSVQEPATATTSVRMYKLSASIREAVAEAQQRGILCHTR